MKEREGNLPIAAMIVVLVLVVAAISGGTLFFLGTQK
jgi:hypothetical protein